MSKLLLFDALEFSKMTYKEYLRTYKTSIRCSVEFENIKHPKMGITLLDDDRDNLYFPWYKDKGSWRKGTPIQIKEGKNLIVVRVPAVKLQGFNKYLLLDGCHRVSQLKPKVIILDWFEVTKDNYMYVTDLLNPCYRHFLNLHLHVKKCKNTIYGAPCLGDTSCIFCRIDKRGKHIRRTCSYE